AKAMQEALEAIESAKDKSTRKAAKKHLKALEASHNGNTVRLTRKLEELTHLESRVTILGHVQRGGTPSPADRLLATRLGTAAAQLIHDGVYGVMVAARGDDIEAIPLKEVAGKRKTVPPDHPWIE
ncbi:MAG: 6-phosphofructokinase, partial [Phototrophicales bacterium]